MGKIWGVMKFTRNPIFFPTRGNPDSRPKISTRSALARISQEKFFKYSGSDLIILHSLAYCIALVITNSSRLIFLICKRTNWLPGWRFEWAVSQSAANCGPWVDRVPPFPVIKFTFIEWRETPSWWWFINLLVRAYFLIKLVFGLSKVVCGKLSSSVKYVNNIAVF